MSSLLPSGNKYKARAEAALEEAKGIEKFQSNVEFGRNLLSNIRQERIARAQLELGNTSADYSSSSAAGAIANIDSSLAGEMRYSYESSHRAQKITDLYKSAQDNMKKYAKKSQMRSTVSSAVGTVIGATAGFFVGGPVGAAAGAQLGQGIGQIAAGTGDTATQQGIQNIAGGFATYLSKQSIDKGKDKYTMYETTSIDPVTNQEIAGSRQYYMPNSSYGLTPINFFRS